MPTNSLKKCVKIQGEQALFAVALILMLTVSAFMVSIPPAKASANVATHVFLSVSPNPAGVNQQVTTLMWLVEISPTLTASVGDRWQNFKLEITKPDGTPITLGPFTADPASFVYTTFTPDQAGTYNLNFSFPGQHVVGTGSIGFPVDSYYGASSFSATLTVQQQQKLGKL